MKMELTAEHEFTLAEHARVEAARGAGDPAWLRTLRGVAIGRFEALGFPTTRDEEWKYTSAVPIARGGFRAAGEEPDAPAKSVIDAVAYGARDGARLVFVNGVFAPELSRLDAPGEGISVESLAAALERRPQELEPHLARHAPLETQAFVALNTAFLHDGALVRLGTGARSGQPIHLLFVSAPGAAPRASHPRTLILAGRDSELSLVETYVSVGKGSSWTNAVTEVVLDENAAVEHTRIQHESAEALHVATTQVRVSRDARYRSHAVSLGSSLSRHDLNVLLAAEGSDCTLNGLYVVAGDQHVDNHTLVDHAQPHGTSRELYKGILAERARGVFNGKVIVRKNAQKTDARQTNNNLLLSPDALVDTKPQLEIFADDVKCAHGATIGQLDRDALFYLRARGLGREEARRLLIRGFASDLVERIPSATVRSALEDALEALLARQLPGGDVREDR